MSCRYLMLALSLCVGTIAFANTTAANTAANTSAVDDILSQPADLAYGEYLAGECLACHANSDAESSNAPKIHGMPAETIVTALVAFRSGTRVNSTMQNVATVLGDEEIASLAAYLASYAD